MKAAAAFIALACLLLAPATRVGFTSDDHIHRIRLDPDSTLPGFEYAPLDVFNFANGDPETARAVADVGIFAWWSAPDVRLSFWRPLSSATHWLDSLIWPDSAAAMVAVNIGWFAVLVWIAAALYRRFEAPGAAMLAIAFFALDDAHGPTVSFISNRNALVCAVLAFGALWAFDRWRRQAWRTGRWLGPALFGLGLLAGESTIAVLGYFAGYALWIERGPWPQRVRALIPYVVLFAAWVVAYSAMGKGAHGSGVYIDLTDQPLRFVSKVIERGPVFLLGQYGLPPSDFWLAYPPDVQRGVWGLAVFSLLVGTFLMWPILRSSPTARFWTLGSLVAAVPVCATFPSDRLLVFAGLGATVQVGMLVRRGLTRAGRAEETWAFRRAATVVAGVLLLLIHGILGPLLLPLRSLTMETPQRGIALFDSALPEGSAIEGRHVVVVSAPADALVSYVPLVRISEGRAVPAVVRQLASGVGAVHVTRIDAYTLRVAPAEGILASEAERMLRDPLQAPVAPGDVVELSDVVVTVLDVSTDGRPTVFDCRFKKVLEDPRYLWMTFEGASFVPFELPAVGSSVDLPPVDVGMLAWTVLGGDF